LRFVEHEHAGNQQPRNVAAIDSELVEQNQPANEQQNQPEQNLSRPFAHSLLPPNQPSLVQM